ncbi:hypothetical protein M569_07798 [Genlisea aurea]|uniref:Uncharacterized protein n=1 Tax=Genlisea aurea TaxID=192259 RepID=S8CJ02_9LAMI|nr:hypothetical protein M569_07798 [Genlisea aurea]
MVRNPSSPDYRRLHSQIPPHPPFTNPSSKSLEISMAGASVAKEQMHPSSKDKFSYYDLHLYISCND